MDALMSYGSSDNEEEVGTVEAGPNAHSSSPPPASGIQQQLPKPRESTSLDSLKRPLDCDELDEIVRPHVWEQEEAPKPPQHKKPKKVLVSIPELIADDSDSDSEDRPRASAVPKHQTKLLSMLPEPTPKPTGKLLLPSSLMSRRKPAPPSAPKPTAAAPAPSQSTDSDSEEDTATDDFLGLDNSNIVVEEPPEPDPQDLFYPAEFDQVGPSSGSLESGAVGKATPSIAHPSQLYNLAEESRLEGSGLEQTAERPPVRAISDAEAQRLIYKYDLQQLGMPPPQPTDEMPELVEVNVDAQLGPNVRENLLKTLTHRPPDAMAEAAKAEQQKNDMPGGHAKRKHQITYLAFVAKQREEQLKNEWAQNKFSRRQTQAKYGF